MIIRFTKAKKDKPPTLTCIRDDGSVTYQAGSEFFAYHDLVHYAVETTLGYPDAFYGLIAGGRDIADFGTRNGIKDTYPENALRAEQIVGAIQFALANAADQSDAELAAQIAADSATQGVSMPPLTPPQVGQIRRLAHDLHARWNALAPGETLELVFVPGSAQVP